MPEIRHDFRDCSGNLAARNDQARAARKPKEEAPEEEAELISLEEADAEKQDKKAPAEDTIIRKKRTPMYPISSARTSKREGDLRQAPRREKTHGQRAT